MTKTLTEQWREGMLPSGWYYVKDINNEIYIAHQYTYGPSICLYEEEVLAPVPSYDEYKELVRKSDKLDKIMSDSATNQGDCQQIVEDNLNRKCSQLENKLAIATKALKEINKNYRFTVAQDVVYKAIKEMKGVK